MIFYRLAPEWVRQDAVILVWPHIHSDWGNSNNENLLQKIEITYVELSRYICKQQKLMLIAYDQEHISHIQKCLSNNGITNDNILFIEITSNDTWVRDYGPVCVKTETGNVILNFKFDAWGKKYPYDKDNVFNYALHEKLNLNSELIDIDFVLEAGNIEVNDQGCLLSSSECFKRGRSPNNITLSALESNFRKWFGSKKIFWINQVRLTGDDTDGHIDNLARFCADDIIVHSSTTSSSDDNFDALTNLKQQLHSIKRQLVNNLELVPIPLPSAISHDNTRLPASYVNFLITNQHVFVPVFNDKHDNIALKTIDDCFPTREIIDIESTTLIQQYGGIHCTSMQIPQGFLR